LHPTVRRRLKMKALVLNEVGRGFDFEEVPVVGSILSE
jgi:hypothetical protein